MSILKEKIAKAISNHVSLEDTYTYELKRAKSAFEVGTMSLEDFEEWTEEDVDDLAKAIVDVLQPQLNENQKNKTNNNLLKINDLAFDLQHDDELTAEQFWKVKQIFEFSLQYQLDENQQIVLDWLKATWIDRKKNCWFPFEVINSLYYQFDVVWGKVSYEEFERIEKDKPYIKAYGELTALEQFKVLEVFSMWAQEQEEENVISRK